MQLVNTAAGIDVLVERDAHIVHPPLHFGPFHRVATIVADVDYVSLPSSTLAFAAHNGALGAFRLVEDGATLFSPLHDANCSLFLSLQLSR